MRAADILHAAAKIEPAGKRCAAEQGDEDKRPQRSAFAARRFAQIGAIVRALRRRWRTALW
ncbi:MAG: hypothetical protein DCF16_15285, partial [Alphaproteobacteria bacterium]